MLATDGVLPLQQVLESEATLGEGREDLSLMAPVHRGLAPLASIDVRIRILLAVAQAGDFIPHLVVDPKFMTLAALEVLFSLPCVVVTLNLLLRNLEDPSVSLLHHVLARIAEVARTLVQPVHHALLQLRVVPAVDLGHEIEGHLGQVRRGNPRGAITDRVDLPSLYVSLEDVDERVVAAPHLANADALHLVFLLLLRSGLPLACALLARPRRVLDLTATVHDGHRGEDGQHEDSRARRRHRKSS